MTPIHSPTYIVNSIYSRFHSVHNLDILNKKNNICQLSYSPYANIFTPLSSIVGQYVNIDHIYVWGIDKILSSTT